MFGQKCLRGVGFCFALSYGEWCEGGKENEQVWPVCEDEEPSTFHTQCGLHSLPTPFRCRRGAGGVGEWREGWRGWGEGGQRSGRGSGQLDGGSFEEKTRAAWAGEKGRGMHARRLSEKRGKNEEKTRKPHFFLVFSSFGISGDQEGNFPRTPHPHPPIPPGRHMCLLTKIRLNALQKVPQSN